MGVGPVKVNASVDEKIAAATTSADRPRRTGSEIATAPVESVKALAIGPRCRITKGGITSSDLATRALEVKRAMVLGLVLPGVSVWELGPETESPGLPQVIFPGNIGGPTTLHDTISISQKPK